jgi:hypothetical protein
MESFFFAAALLAALASPANGGDPKAARTKDACSDGLVLDLNGRCVPKFVAPKRKACPLPHMRFGGHEEKLGGRMASFWCEEGWTLVPEENDYAMCKMGEWDRWLPMCVRPGCPRADLDAGSSVQVHLEMAGALVRFTCARREYEMEGGAVLGCDGEFWNGTAPVCKPPPTTTTTSTTATTSPTTRAAWHSASSSASPSVFSASHMLTLIFTVAVTSLSARRTT